MFTLKFYSPVPDTDIMTQTVISADKYEKIDFDADGRFQVIANGVEYNIHKLDDSPESVSYFTQCYIENQSGKTIDKISAYGSLGVAA